MNEGEYPDTELWCRLCLKEHNDAYAIFGKDESLSLPMRLISCLSLEAKPNDGLPKKICDECRYQLEKSFVFRHRSQEADKRLRKHNRLISLGKKSRVFAKSVDNDSDVEELELEESVGFINTLEKQRELMEEKGRKLLLEEKEAELVQRLSIMREKLQIEVRKELREEVKTEVRKELREEVKNEVRKELHDEVQEESRKVQLKSLLGELEVFLAQKKAGQWQSITEILGETSINIETEAPKSLERSSPKENLKRKRSKDPPLPAITKRRESTMQAQVVEEELQTEVKSEQQTKNSAKLPTSTENEVMSEVSDEIYFVNAESATSPSEFQLDDNTTSYNIKDNGDIQFAKGKSAEIEDFLVFDLDADIREDAQLDAENENVIILSSNMESAELITTKDSKSEFVVKRAPRRAEPSVGRASDTVKTFKCQLCPVAFSTNKALSRHLSTHIKTIKNGTGGSMQCPLCQLQLSCASSLKRHMVIHTGIKPYKCTECDYSFSQREVLKRHMDTHTGEKRHQCPQCQHLFAQKTNLLQHISRVHREDKDVNDKRICHLCGKSFHNPSGLSRHLATHNGVSYGCNQCGRQFIDRSAVQRHVKNVHNATGDSTPESNDK
ncbi:zinc finger protein 135 [Drosophila busckii]|uniref:zinc finger protein 135 n=1 Tax=Drosophila busckii TaxID=30019 RepID=UPI00083EEB90|nr:zinc finger protein 135 [Drosophila busckii]